MRTLTIRIRMDNEAFSDGNRNREAARILAMLADRIACWPVLGLGTQGRLIDLNGQTCGDYAVTEG